MLSWLKFLHCGALAACLLLVTGVAACTANAQAITVSHNEFLKDGAPWVPNSFTLVGHVAPAGHVLSWLQGARQLQGPALLQQARSLGANTLRFQVSEPGLDPQASIYDAGYIQEVIQGVRQARAAGFVVIISMQWEAPSGLKGLTDMPNDSTGRAWSQLSHEFANDGGVMLELFNEPSMWETNPQAWPTWQSGMQSLVNEIRAAGARNVLILDGIHGSHLLAGAPAIHDPLNQLAYAVHPYFDDTNKTAADWTRQWGDFAAWHPVLITEWNALSTLNCHPDDPEVSQQLMEYIGQHHIGLDLWALDLRSTILNGQGQLLGFADYTCGKAGDGAAAVGVAYMKSH
jgi:endoglucanase